MSINFITPSLYPYPINQSAMSRSLSQTLTRIPTARNTFSVFARRNQSNLPKIRVAKSNEEIEKIALKKLEDAIHRLIVKKSEPDWLPLIPGASYWVPPKSESRDVALAVVELFKDSAGVIELKKNDGSFLYTAKRGWPTSPKFFEGKPNSPNSPVEEEMDSENSGQSEEDEE